MNRPIIEDAKMTSTCEVEEVKKYCINFVNHNTEVNGDVEKIKAKLKSRFDKTEKQKDKEIRDRMRGLEVKGNLGDYSDYLRKLRKQAVESMSKKKEVKIKFQNG